MLPFAPPISICKMVFDVFRMHSLGRIQFRQSTSQKAEKRRERKKVARVEKTIKKRAKEETSQAAEQQALVRRRKKVRGVFRDVPSLRPRRLNGW